MMSAEPDVIKHVELEQSNEFSFMGQAVSIDCKDMLSCVVLYYCLTLNM